MAAFCRARVWAWSSTWLGLMKPAATSYTAVAVSADPASESVIDLQILARGRDGVGGDAVGEHRLERAQRLALQEIVGGWRRR